jgi:hypothetical protein
MWLVSDNGNRIDWIISKTDKFLHNETSQSLRSHTLLTYLAVDNGNIRYKSE